MELDNARTMDDAMLAVGLDAATVVARRALPSKSSDEREIVTCRMPDGRERQFFCKFGSLAEVAAGPDHRLGVAYEAHVYDELLHAWPDDVPPLHGVVLDESTQTLVLALDYLEGGAPLNKAAQPEGGLLAAARWIARFHSWGEKASVPAFLRRCDTDFYRHWLGRAAAFTSELHARYPWLRPLCERGMRRLPSLLPLATIIHGEYQANNIIIVQGRNVATDWASAALAAGEIDLASLTWGWDRDVAARCERQYCRVRWPGGAPAEFALRLTAARVFLHLRRLGNAEPKDDKGAAIAELDALAPLVEKLEELDR